MVRSTDNMFLHSKIPQAAEDRDTYYFGADELFRRANVRKFLGGASIRDDMNKRPGICLVFCFSGFLFVEPCD